jgi:hypothetical protein
MTPALRSRARWLAVPVTALALAAAGCGDDDEDSGNEPAASAPTTETTTTDAPPSTTEEAPAETPAGGEDAVKEAILAYTFEGDCEVMTDKFLEDQAFVGDTRKERCDYVKDTFQKPQYSESDVKFRKVEINGTEAVATVGSDIANVEADYHMVAEDGEWKIDEVDLS